MTDPSQRKLIIAIDGAAGAGKSTVAFRLARKLGYVNLESGAMYRALALRAIEWDASFDDEAALLKMAQDSRITLDPAIGGNRVLAQRKRRFRAHPRARCIGGGVAGFGASQGARVDGGAAARAGHRRRRGDGGARHWDESFSDADLKIFLDADPVIREQRRLEQQKVKGASGDRRYPLELRERDQRDRTRAASPLVAAENAVVLDLTHMSENEVVNRIRGVGGAAAGGAALRAVVACVRNAPTNSERILSREVGKDCQLGGYPPSPWVLESLS